MLIGCFALSDLHSHPGVDAPRFCSGSLPREGQLFATTSWNSAAFGRLRSFWNRLLCIAMFVVGRVLQG